MSIEFWVHAMLESSIANDIRAHRHNWFLKLFEIRENNSIALLNVVSGVVDSVAWPIYAIDTSKHRRFHGVGIELQPICCCDFVETEHIQNSESFVTTPMARWTTWANWLDLEFRIIYSYSRISIYICVSDWKTGSKPLSSILNNHFRKSIWITFILNRGTRQSVAHIRCV